MSDVNIECPACKGKGIVPLPETLQSVLNVVRESKASVDADFVRVCLDLNIGTTAYSNRLHRLLTMGLVDRHRAGKFWLYKAAANEHPSSMPVVPEGASRNRFRKTMGACVLR